jgi:chemotaxis protein CheD
MKTITIGIAESKIAHSPDKIATLGLGSCIGLVLYDPVTKVGGMVHILLPKAPNDPVATNKFKFADTGIMELIRMMEASGATKSRLLAKAAGGAHMFNSSYNADIMNIGQRNIDMCLRILKENSIKITGEDTGGITGRSIEFCCLSNVLQVRIVSPREIRYI